MTPRDLARRRRAARAYEAYWRAMDFGDWAIVACDAAYSAWRLSGEWPSPSWTTLACVALLPVGIAVALSDKRGIAERLARRALLRRALGPSAGRAARRRPSRPGPESATTEGA